MTRTREVALPHINGLTTRKFRLTHVCSGADDRWVMGVFFYSCAPVVSVCVCVLVCLVRIKIARVVCVEQYLSCSRSPLYRAQLLPRRPLHLQLLYGIFSASVMSRFATA